jgi:hypothetical protein
MAWLRLAPAPRATATLVVSPSDVELSEESASHQSVDDLGNEWGDISIVDGPFVEGSIVLHRAKFAILLFDKEEVSRIRASGFAYGSSSQVLFYELMTLHNLFLGKWKESARECRGSSR